MTCPFNGGSCSSNRGLFLKDQPVRGSHGKHNICAISKIAVELADINRKGLKIAAGLADDTVVKILEVDEAGMPLR